VGPVTEQVVESDVPHGGHGLVWEIDMVCVRVKHRMAKVRLLCYRWLSPFLKPGAVVGKRYGSCWGEA
jgi:hypothetical protein